MTTGSIRRPKTTGLAVGDPVPGVPKVDPIVIIDNVTRRFGGLTAVDVDHVEIPRGAITALIGPNGAGKTTLFNLICGFDNPNSGTWSFDGDGGPTAERTFFAGTPAVDQPGDVMFAGLGHRRTGVSERPSLPA